MIETLTQAHTLQHLRGARPRIALPRQLQRQHDVFQSREIAQQLKALEDKAHLLCPHRRPVVLAECKQILAQQADRAAAGGIETGQNRQQSTLTRARGPHNGNGFAGRETQIDIPQNIQHACGIAHRFGQLLNGNQRNGKSCGHESIG